LGEKGDAALRESPHATVSQGMHDELDEAHMVEPDDAGL